jgi:hypothetical protein
MISYKQRILLNGPIGLTINAKETRISKAESTSLWNKIGKELYAFFTDPFETDWEKKTGMFWHDWR